jgi:ABC-type multidrug transport system fused ATPase/permease subunit
MRAVWHMMWPHLRKHISGLLVMFVIAVIVSASPYFFSFLGKWLVDEALQVTGAPKAAAIENAAGAGAKDAATSAGTAGMAASTDARPADTAKAGAPKAVAPVSGEWKPKTQPEKTRLLLIFFIVSIAVHLLTTGISAVSDLINSKMVFEMICDLRSQAHDRLQSAKMAFFAREQVGQIMSRLLDDTNAIPGNLTNLVINVCTQIVMLIMGIVLLLRLNVRLTLIALAALPLYVLVSYFFLARIKRNTEQSRTAESEFNGFVVERLSGVVNIKNYAQEDREVVNFGVSLDKNMGLGLEASKLGLYFGTLTSVVTNVGTLAVLTYGFLNIKAGSMQLGEVMAFYGVAAQLFVPVSVLVSMMNVAQVLEVWAGRVNRILEAPREEDDALEAAAMPPVKGEIAFEHVSLRYEEGGPFAVEDATLAIPAGQSVCIVGPPGSGKSSLVTMLSRLWDPSSGVIKVDGVDITNMPLRRLRRVMGTIFSEPLVFTGTIAENIAYGNPEATRQKIEEAAKLAELHDYVMGLKDKYETRVGQGGLSLDVEALTTLSVARAMVAEPAILTVDEGFAPISEELEERLRAMIRCQLADRTIIITTNRMSICKHADMVVVMEKGKIRQVGTHKSLMAVPGSYRRMYARQMGMAELAAAATEYGTPYG